MRRVVWFLLAGCLSKPPRPEPTPADAPVASCTQPTIHDDFDDPFAPVCGVGFEDTNAASTIERGGGVLRMTPAADQINDASCTWASFAFDQGTFVELRQPLATGGSYTILQLDSGAAAVGLQVIDETGPMLEMFDTAQSGSLIALPYDASAMRWLRLRPDNGRVTGEYSADGEHWTLAATTTTSPAPTDTTTVSLNAGVYNPLPAPGVAEFDNFGVCP